MTQGASGVSTRTLFIAFFISGFAALIYQTTWQRALFALYGINIEAVTLVVTVFMLGLGLGSLAGGVISARPGVRLLRWFGGIECAIGLFGAVSLPLFWWVGEATLTAPISLTALIIFGLLLPPTLLMGSTLPLLVAALVRVNQNVGQSVGALYFINTLGSGVASMVAVIGLMPALGLQRAVLVAVGLNLLVGVGAIIADARLGGITAHTSSAPSEAARDDDQAQHAEPTTT